ncbi:uncharacterized protein JCM10292_000631 [Rhodotorula paludigena]|uniref:uncharacterized protein n=1 Tax=Rhodotorula paludigena TaxID=86838 RepID=UPI00316BC041
MSAPKHDDRDLEAHSDVDEKVSSGATTPNNNNNNNAPANDAASDYRNENVHKTNGVAMMEAISTAAHASDNSGRWMLYSIAASMFAMYWAYCQAGSTTYSYAPLATSSFASHSGGLAASNIATGIISSVCTPFLAKIADVFSRPWLLVIAMISYVVGFIIILKSPTLAAYVVGQVFSSIGGAGLSLLSSILAADLCPLQWRGLAQGILSSPYIVTPWYTSYIVAALADDEGWRWGYGMYAIIFPAVMMPSIVLLFWLQHRARKMGLVTIASSGDARAAAAEYAEKEGQAVAEPGFNNAMPAVKPKMGLGARIWLAFHELDAFGLLLLGFGWSLLLLPFSLSSTAKGGYSNPSLIAMFVVGILCLMAYTVYEWRFAKFPSMPIRLIKNRTFMTAVVIDTIYQLAGYLQLQYLASYVWIVTDYSAKEWNYFNNTLTVGLCAGGVVAGILMRITHRYKFIQLFGLVLKIIAYGLLVDKDGVHDTARLVLSQALTGIGGSFSVVGSQVGSQASVPHQDVALAIAVLGLWSSVGAGIGEAIAAAVWNANMPGNLATYIPSANATEIATFFGDITTIKAYPYDSEIRRGAIEAYETTVYPLWAAALGLSFIPLICACFQNNYYLGESQNAWDMKDTEGNVVQGEPDRYVKAKGWRRVLRFWDL